MRQIPLYKDTPLAAVEVATPIDSDPSCQLCKFGESARNICMMAEGDPGGILIVGEYPGVMEDRAGIPFSGPAGRYVRKLVNSYFDGPVAYDNGIRCAPGSTAIGDKQLAACRGHLAATIREVQPKRVIAMGNKAINSVLGRSVQAQSVRRGYGWLYNEDIDGTCTPIPVFELMNPVSAMRNRFLRNWFESDLRYALNCAMPALPPWEEYCYVVENAQDAEYACEALRQELWFSFDTETAGMMYNKEFQVVTLAAVARYSNEVFVWDRDGLIRKTTRGPLIKLLNDRQVKKVGQNLKYDAHAVDSGLGAELANYHGDSRLWRRLLYADVDASLDVMAELVGLGGIKGEAEEALVKACRVIAKARREYIKDKDSFLLDPNGVDPLILAACENPDESSKTYAYGLLPWEILVRYCARDALSTARVCELLEKRLEKNAPVKRVWDVIVKDANQSIKQIECWGIPTSMENAKLYQKHLETKMDDVQNRFAQYKDLKPNSPASVSALLFKKIGLHPPKLTNSGGPSTDSESLKALKGQHPVVDDLLEWRRLTKLHGFAKGIQAHICDDERIHPSIKIDGTRTGRLSCVVEGTPIEVLRDVAKYPQGVPIEDVKPGDYAYTFDCENKITLRKVNQVFNNGKRRIVRLHWLGQGGHTKGFLDLTADHKVRLFDGSYRQVCELKKGDRVCGISRGKTYYGYSRMWVSHFKGEFKEHKFVYSNFNSDDPEHVHHIDGNKLNNVPSNLRGQSAFEHLSYHAKNQPSELLKKRAETMRKRNASGLIKHATGKQHGMYKELSYSDAVNLLENNKWSITLAARNNGWDFGTFVHKLKELGFDREEIKKKSRVVRRAAIIQYAAHARSVRLGNNHIVDWIEDLDQEAQVYDLEIEETHNYVAGGIAIHNCVNPNLQNIARPKDVESKMARDLFVAREGYIFVEADFSQLELRVASMLCQDPKMLKIWQSGVDYHQKTAELISQVAWGIPPSEVTKEHRSKAKVPNFGVIYGMTPKGLAGKIGCTVQEAENIVNAIKGQFTVFNRWCKQQIINARKTGYTHTWWDGQEARRRPLVNIADPDDRRRNGAENASLNTPVQGTASDFCLASIVQLVKWLKEDAVPAELVLTVHDSVMFHVEESAKDEVCYNAVRIMESWPSAGVPLVADLKVGTAWGSLEDYKLA